MSPPVSPTPPSPRKKKTSRKRAVPKNPQPRGSQNPSPARPPPNVASADSKLTSAANGAPVGSENPTPRPDIPQAEVVGVGGGGLQCSRCGCRHLPVYYTRPVKTGVIRRIRFCRNCGHRKITIEKEPPPHGDGDGGGGSGGLN